MILLLPCCLISSLWPGPGIWENDLRGRWSKGRHGLASHGSCAESAWSLAPPADSSQTVCRCSPPPADSFRKDTKSWSVTWTQDVCQSNDYQITFIITQTHLNTLVYCYTLLPLLLVHLVSEANGVDHSEAQSDITLLQVVGLSPQLHLRLKVGRLKVLKVGIEQSIH